MPAFLYTVARIILANCFRLFLNLVQLAANVARSILARCFRLFLNLAQLAADFVFGVLWHMLKQCVLLARKEVGLTAILLLLFVL